MPDLPPPSKGISNDPARSGMAMVSPYILCLDRSRQFLYLESPQITPSVCVPVSHGAMITQGVGSSAHLKITFKLPTF